jgi:hypothetical protein|nr:MAG TPA: hypothetical protein [Caudoviricetes sp.]DAY69988.1 MAG TPA: hypothetical protein [Caudoviricetes sp.]
MEVAINTLYSNRELYPFIPRHVFDALEAAYLEGKEIITIDEAEYNAILSNAKAAGICHV